MLTIATVHKARFQKKKKKLVEFSPKGGGGQRWVDFPLRIKIKNNISLKPLESPNKHFKTHFFF